ncbi:uncharacterized protein LOC116849776 isoform X2 [Odontomachus brunneus]|uniref:uncharacterized protein LOC116849776 isoform X2 n=1 Tax=Odontomachus brunneus TaxID=486640 RepID=UPI0013F226EF|nr:uncharacterized protein LOC116849776 isoform X2 [Odontomachus brunneus]
MASRRYMPLAAILITICLDLSSVVVNVVAAAVVWDPKDSRYDSYNLDKGPVFYEAYYPDVQDNAYHEKRYFDRSAVLETSFQIPSNRFAYSAESADRPVSNDESSYVLVNNENLPEEQRKNVGPRRNLVPFDDQRSILLEDDNGSSPATNIGEISKLVRRAISRDLENWSALERYLEGNSNQGQSMPPLRSELRPRESRKNKEDDSYPLQVNQLNFDPSKQLNFEVLRKLEARDVKVRPAYFEKIRRNDGSVMSVADTRTAVAPIGITSDSLSLEDIFQPRPQIIKYTFLKKAMTRHDEPSKAVIDNTTPRNYGDNLIRDEIANDGHDGRLARGSVKVTSIQVSELPRHKTRHHHGEWSKRDYAAHRHRPTVAHPAAQ